MKTTTLFSLGLLLTLSANPVNAAENEFEQLLEVLRDNGSINQQQYDKLKRSRTKSTSGSEDIKLSSKGGIELASYDGNFSFEFGGRLMVDVAAYNEKLTKMGDGTELRRARFEMEGTVYADWAYELGVDFADKDADVKDAYIAYVGHWPHKFTIGQHKEHFSLEELTSSRYISFMERALINEFAPGRNIGISLHSYAEQWTGAIGVFGDAFDDDPGSEGDEGWALTGRLTYSPYHSDHHALHFGVAASQRHLDESRTIKFDSRPESHITEVKFVNTDDISNTDTANYYGLEFAGVFGPISLQSEYIQVSLERQPGFENVSFDGSYVYLSWFVTGESRKYKFKKGAFGRVKPKGKRGALELLARYSSIDLNDKSITGGKEENLTLGVNWYINPQLRLMANYIKVDNDINADDAGTAIGNDSPDIFQMRMQIDF